MIARIQNPVDQVVIHETTLAQPQLYLDINDILKKHKRIYRFVFFDESSMHDFFETYVSAFETNTNILSHKTFVALACEGRKANSSDDEEDESDTENEMEMTQVEEIENEEENNDGEDVEGGGNEDQDGYVFDEFEDSQDFFNLNRNRNF